MYNICIINNFRGGFATAILYPLIKALKEVGNHLIVISGARNEKLLILEDELKKLSNDYYEKENKKIDRVFAVGPIPMMKATSDLIRKYNLDSGNCFVYI